MRRRVVQVPEPGLERKAEGAACDPERGIGRGARQPARGEQPREHAHRRHEREAEAAGDRDRSKSRQWAAHEHHEADQDHEERRRASSAAQARGEHEQGEHRGAKSKIRRVIAEPSPRGEQGDRERNRDGDGESVGGLDRCARQQLEGRLAPSRHRLRALERGPEPRLGERNDRQQGADPDRRESDRDGEGCALGGGRLIDSRRQVRRARRIELRRERDPRGDRERKAHRRDPGGELGKRRCDATRSRQERIGELRWHGRRGPGDLKQEECREPERRTPQGRAAKHRQRRERHRRQDREGEQRLVEGKRHRCSTICAYTAAIVSIERSHA